jgi:hypothetical protein
MAPQAGVETPLDRGDTPVNSNSLKAVLGEGEQPFSSKPQTWQLTIVWGAAFDIAVRSHQPPTVFLSYLVIPMT